MCTSGMPNRAVSAAARMSQLAATSRPAPRQKPLMRPITGTGHSRIALQAWCRRVMNSRALSAHRRAELVQVGAADEGAVAGAGQHDGAQRLVRAEPAEGLGQRHDQRRRQAVELGCVVDGDAGDARRRRPAPRSSHARPLPTLLVSRGLARSSLADRTMPLQNRVTPEGEIIATPHRGLMMGNRGGAFHLPDRTLGARRWATRQWIACVLEFKGRHRAAMMQPNRYTELFFLDEATALAAGHRPCFECRRRDAERFAALWAETRGWPAPARAPEMDVGLHAERVGAAGPEGHLSRPARRACRTAPSCASTTADAAQPYLVDGDRLLAWTPGRLRRGPAAPRPARGGGADAALDRCRTFSRISPHAASLGRRPGRTVGQRDVGETAHDPLDAQDARCGASTPCSSLVLGVSFLAKIADHIPGLAGTGLEKLAQGRLRVPARHVAADRHRRRRLHHQRVPEAARASWRR